jgi:hypothetical protein
MSVATKLQAVYDAVSSMKTAIIGKGQDLTSVPLSGWASKIDAIETGGGATIENVPLPAPLFTNFYSEPLGNSSLKVRWSPASDPNITKQLLVYKLGGIPSFPIVDDFIELDPGITEYTFTNFENGVEYGIVVFTVNSAGAIQTCIFTGNTSFIKNTNTYRYLSLSEVLVPSEFIGTTHAFACFIDKFNKLILVACQSTLRGIWRLDPNTMLWERLSTVYYMAGIITSGSYFFKGYDGDIFILLANVSNGNSYVLKWDGSVFTPITPTLVAGSGALSSYYMRRVLGYYYTDDYILVTGDRSDTSYRCSYILLPNGTIRFLSTRLSTDVTPTSNGDIATDSYTNTSSIVVYNITTNVRTSLSFGTNVAYIGTANGFMYFVSQLSPYLFSYDGSTLVPCTILDTDFVVTSVNTTCKLVKGSDGIYYLLQVPPYSATATFGGYILIYLESTNVFRKVKNLDTTSGNLVLREVPVVHNGQKLYMPRYNSYTADTSSLFKLVNGELLSYYTSPSSTIADAYNFEGIGRWFKSSNGYTFWCNYYAGQYNATTSRFVVFDPSGVVVYDGFRPSGISDNNFGPIACFEASNGEVYILKPNLLRVYKYDFLNNVLVDLGNPGGSVIGVPSDEPPFNASYEKDNELHMVCTSDTTGNLSVIVNLETEQLRRGTENLGILLDNRYLATSSQVIDMSTDSVISNKVYNVSSIRGGLEGKPESVYAISTDRQYILFSSSIEEL